MKTITIGRGEGCNIYIDDESMSRRHAIIKIPTFGGMEIVDMSKNGTFVNGVRLRPNVPFPVKRKDVVNFADVRELDWSLVPDPMKYYKLAGIIVGGIIVLLLAVFLFKNLFSSSAKAPVTPATEHVQKPIRMEEYKKPAQAETEPVETPAEEQPSSPPSAAPDATTGTDNQIIDVYGAARSAKKKREAEERVRRQKAKEVQRQKEQQKKEQQQKEQQKQEENKQPSNGNSSKKEYKPEMI